MAKTLNHTLTVWRNQRTPTRNKTFVTHNGCDQTSHLAWTGGCLSLLTTCQFWQAHLAGAFRPGQIAGIPRGSTFLVVHTRIAPSASGQLKKCRMCAAGACLPMQQGSRPVDGCARLCTVLEEGHPDSWEHGSWSRPSTLGQQFPLLSDRSQCESEMNVQTK